MCTNRIICVNREDSARSGPGSPSPAHLFHSLLSRVACCATPDNITNSLLSRPGHINPENIKNNKTRRVGGFSCPPDSAFAIDEPTKNRYYRLNKRMWRNWQTHRLQVPAGLGPWRFDSSHPHCLAIISCGRPPSTQDLTKGPCQADKYLGQTCILRTSFSRH